MAGDIKGPQMINNIAITSFEQMYKELSEMCPLLSDDWIKEAIERPTTVPIINTIMALALEVREYRKRYGRLTNLEGEVKWLSKE